MENVQHKKKLYENETVKNRRRIEPRPIFTVTVHILSNQIKSSTRRV